MSNDIALHIVTVIMQVWIYLAPPMFAMFLLKVMIFD